MITPNTDLTFSIRNMSVPEPYLIEWKVLNRGTEAERLNMIRGQILEENQFERSETADFRGNHYVECYIIKNQSVVAKERINVKISGY